MIPLRAQGDKDGMSVTGGKHVTQYVMVITLYIDSRVSRDLLAGINEPSCS